MKSRNTKCQKWLCCWTDVLHQTDSNLKFGWWNFLLTHVCPVLSFSDPYEDHSSSLRLITIKPMTAQPTYSYPSSSSHSQDSVVLNGEVRLRCSFEIKTSQIWYFLTSLLSRKLKTCSEIAQTLTALGGHQCPLRHHKELIWRILTLRHTLSNKRTRH